MGFVPWGAVFAAVEGDGPWKIYALVDPRDDGVRYVGVTTRTLASRLKGHLGKPTNDGMQAWFEDLAAAGLVPHIRLLLAPRNDWQQAERGWIAWFRERGELLNLDPGGICRTKDGKPIPSRMREPLKWNEPAPRWRRKPKKRDPWSHVRGTRSAKAAEISRRQMKRP